MTLTDSMVMEINRLMFGLIFKQSVCQFPEGRWSKIRKRRFWYIFFYEAAVKFFVVWVDSVDCGMWGQIENNLFLTFKPWVCGSNPHGGFFFLRSVETQTSNLKGQNIHMTDSGLTLSKTLSFNALQFIEL